MNVEINYILEEDQEKAAVYLYEKNKYQDEIKAYFENNEMQKKVITVTEDGKMRYISIDLIYSIEAEANVRLIHTKDCIYHSSLRLYELEDLLPRYFIRVSKSSILNTKKVSLYQPLPNGLMEARMENKSQVYISRRYLRGLLDKLEK